MTSGGKAAGPAETEGQRGQSLPPTPNFGQITSKPLYYITACPPRFSDLPPALNWVYSMYCSQSQCFFPIIMIIIEVILVNLSQILRGAGKEPRGEGPNTLLNLTFFSKKTETFLQRSCNSTAAATLEKWSSSSFRVCTKMYFYNLSSILVLASWSIKRLNKD